MKKPYRKPKLTKKKLSPRQRNMLAFIRKYHEKHGYMPAIREIGKACDINSTSVVNYNLNKLAKLGFIERTPIRSRAMRLTEPSRVGEVA